MNGTAALAEVVEIGDILSKGEEADWDVRTKVMVRLQELAPSAAKYESFANGLDKIKQHLVAQVIRSPPPVSPPPAHAFGGGEVVVWVD
jgi:hypothetical protein